MALEIPALDERSFQWGIEEADAEPRGMTAAGTYAIAGLLPMAKGESQSETCELTGVRRVL